MRDAVLVAGGTGHVGSRLVPELVRAGHDVKILSRQERELLATVVSRQNDCHY